VQKRLSPSICHLGCGLGWAERSTSSIVFFRWRQWPMCTSSIAFARWRQCAIMGGHFGATWRIRLNRASAAAMWPYVKLLWPLVILWYRAINYAGCPSAFQHYNKAIVESRLRPRLLYSTLQATNQQQRPAYRYR